MSESADRPTTLVTGGTGFLGAAFVRELARRGESVAVLGRNPDRVERRFAGTSVQARRGDITRPETLEKSFAHVDTIIQCVQFSGFPVEDPSRGLTFSEVDGRGTCNVVEAAGHAGVQRFIYLSGVGADPSSDRAWFRAKGLAETAIRDSGMSYSIVQPSWVYGKEDRSLNVFIRIMRLNPLFFPQIGDGQQRLNPLYVEDLAAVVANLALGEAMQDGTFELGGPVTYTLDEILRVTMEVTGLQRPIIHFPVSLFKAGAAFAELLPGQLLSRDAVDFVAQGAVADNTHFRELFSHRLTPLADGLGAYV
jgi:NADH dehydrogenase